MYFGSNENNEPIHVHVSKGKPVPNAMKLTEMSFEKVDRAEWAEPRTDVYAALDYYFKNLNQGRPYFLAGHSQGSRLCYIVLSEYMREHPDYYSNMIAAYCLGDSLTKTYLEENPHVKAAPTAPAPSIATVLILLFILTLPFSSIIIYS